LLIAVLNTWLRRQMEIYTSTEIMIDTPGRWLIESPGGQGRYTVDKPTMIIVDAIRWE